MSYLRYTKGLRSAPSPPAYTKGLRSAPSQPTYTKGLQSAPSPAPGNDHYLSISLSVETLIIFFYLMKYIDIQINYRY